MPNHYYSRRLELCDEFLSKQKTAPATDCWREKLFDTLCREAVLAERKAVLQRIRIRDADSAAVGPMWVVRDAVDEFMQTGVVHRLNDQRALDEVLQTLVADKGAREACINGLVNAKDLVLPTKEGLIFVAAVEGHPDGITRIVAHVEFQRYDCRMYAHTYLAGARCSARLLPSHELVAQTPHNIHATALTWSFLERAEQAYRYGIGSVHIPFALTREHFFAMACAYKGLCIRCGRLGHQAPACCAVNMADWAGAGALKPK